MYPLTLGLAIETKELWEEVKNSIQDLPIRIVLDQGDIDDMPGFIEKVVRLRPDAVLIDISKLKKPLEEVVETFKTGCGDVMLVALHTSSDADSILRALRAGVHEYLFPPLKDNLRRAIERRGQEQRKGRDGGKQAGKAAGFLSVKGGCGATTLACHVAVELGKQREAKVLLADFDIESGAISFLMKSGTQYSVMDAVNNLHRLDHNYWKALVSNGFQGLEIISAPVDLARTTFPRQEQLRHILAFVRSQYDWTIVDLGRNLSHNAMCVMEDLDESYIVATLDVPALHRAKQIVQTMVDRGFPRTRLRLILNRTPKRMDIMPDDVEKMLGISVISQIPDEYQELYEAYSEGKLLNGSSSLSKHFVRLAHRLSGVQQEEKKKTFGLW